MTILKLYSKLLLRISTKYGPKSTSLNIFVRLLQNSFSKYPFSG